MHPELQSLFDEHTTPQHASKRDVHDQTSAIGRLVANVMKQVLEYRTRILEAESAPHDHALDSKLEMMHQTFGAIEREAQALSHGNRELAKAMTQLDRYMAEWRTDIEAYLAHQAARAAALAAGATPEVVQ